MERHDSCDALRMKILIVAAMLLSLSGCSTMGTIMQGMGQGLTSGNRTHETRRTLNCQKDYQIGNTVAYNCR